MTCSSSVEVAPRLPRTTPPSYIKGATRFSVEGGAFKDPTQLVKRVKGMAPLMRELNKTRIDHEHGPARGEGNWALVYLAYVIGGSPTMRPWLRRQENNRELWRACGFDRAPGASTLWDRFIELEEFSEVFEAAAQYLVRKVRQQAPEVGMWLVADGTECETHAQPQHACGPNDACPGSRRAGFEPHFPKVTPTEAAERRSEGDGNAPVQGPAAPAPAGLTPIPPDGYREETRDGVRFTSGGHWWSSRDRDAGSRSYTDHKAWHGFMCVKLTDIHTGAVMAVRIIPAHHQEVGALPQVYAAAREAIGTDPIALVADAGYSTTEAFTFCTTRGVTPVFPWRDYTHDQKYPKAPAGEKWDRHGIPLCPGCGLPGDFVRFSATGTPRTWYRCSMPSTPECEGEHSIANLVAPRRLLPIWRTSEVYASLRRQAGIYERVHEAWRANYLVGGKTLRERPRRIGIACQQLRASAALLIEWVWTSVRQGWIGERPLRAVAARLSPRKVLAGVFGARRAESLFGGRYPSRGGPPTA